MSKYFFGILILFSVFSCKKKEIDFIISGKISDATFGVGLEGATLTLTEIPVASGGQKVIGTTVLNSTGNYSFTFPRGKVEKYIIKITKNQYFDIEDVIKFSEFSPGKELIKNYSTTAKSWVKMRFVNIAPNSVNDMLKFHQQAGKVGCNECCPVIEHNLVGIVDTSFICISDGQSTFSYFYQVAGTSNQGIETITTVPFDTVEIVKNY